VRYLLSVAVFKLANWLHIPFDLCSTLSLRFLNLVLVCGVLPLITTNLYQNIHPGASERSLILASVLPAFPLLSFFGNLYYTDVLSTTLVLYCYLLAIKKRYISSSIVPLFIQLITL
jgi:alpha-1,2-glucosyltransferase